MGAVSPLHQAQPNIKFSEISYSATTRRESPWSVQPKPQTTKHESQKILLETVDEKLISSSVHVQDGSEAENPPLACLAFSVIDRIGCIL